MHKALQLRERTYFCLVLSFLKGISALFVSGLYHDLCHLHHTLQYKYLWCSMPQISNSWYIFIIFSWYFGLIFSIWLCKDIWKIECQGQNYSRVFSFNMRLLSVEHVEHMMKYGLKWDFRVARCKTKGRSRSWWDTNKGIHCNNIKQIKPGDIYYKIVILLWWTFDLWY